MGISIDAVRNDAQLILDKLVGKAAEAVEVQHMDVDEYADGVIRLYSDTYVGSEFKLSAAAKLWSSLDYADANEYDALDCKLALVSHADCGYTAFVRYERCRASNSYHTFTAFVVKSDNEQAMSRLLDLYEECLSSIHHRRLEEAFKASNALIALGRNQRPKHAHTSLKELRDKRLKSQCHAYVVISHEEGCDAQPILLYARSISEAEETGESLHKQVEGIGSVYIDAAVPMASLEMNNI